ncbi:MAG: hypothetical protein ACKVVP_08500 [Chloroflexota bacterium]
MLVGCGWMREPEVAAERGVTALRCPDAVDVGLDGTGLNRGTGESALFRTTVLTVASGVG